MYRLNYVAVTVLHLAMDRREEARQSLQRVLDAPVHPDWVPEVGEFKDKARARLAALQRR